MNAEMHVGRIRGRRIRSAFAIGLVVATVAGCSTSTSFRTSSARTPTTPAAAQIAIRTTLRGLSELPVRVKWEATTNVAPDEIAAVDFSIDGRLAWVEHQAPFDYADEGNDLVTTFLTPGAHTFVTMVTTTSGATARETVTAAVAAAPAVPSRLAGVAWVRTLTPADQQAATLSGGLPPTGVWHLKFTSEGMRTSGPDGGGVLSDVLYGPGTGLSLRATIETPPFPNDFNGGYCSDVDPTHIWTYTLGRDDRRLTLAPVGNDPCGDRVAVLNGTWARG